jgi:hypothetical protein
LSSSKSRDFPAQKKDNEEKEKSFVPCVPCYEQRSVKGFRVKSNYPVSDVLKKEK